MARKYSCTEEQFLKDAAAHQMEVLRDDGVNRHLRFKNPESNAYWFDIITWPGTLCVDGDMGTFVFRRLHDMFVFFRTDQEHYDRTGRADRLAINPSYWDEKLRAPAPRDAQEYCADSFRQHVQEAFDSWKESNQPDDDEWTTDADRRQFEEQRDALWAALKEDVMSYADDGLIRAYDAARDFRCDEVPGFNLEDCWEWDCQVFKFDFLWNCYAIAWGIKTYDKARKFRWTRALYRRAHREARVYDGYGFMYHNEPALVRRWRELWDQHPQHEDPLTRPQWQRYLPDDGIPF